MPGGRKCKGWGTWWVGKCLGFGSVAENCEALGKCRPLSTFYLHVELGFALNLLCIFGVQKDAVSLPCYKMEE